MIIKNLLYNLYILLLFNIENIMRCIMGIFSGIN